MDASERHTMKLPAVVDRLLAWFIRPDRALDERVTCRIIVGFSLTLVAWTPLYLALYYVAFPPEYRWSMVNGLAVGMLFVAGVPTLIRLGAPLSAAVSLLCLDCLGLLIYTCSMTGGFESPLLPWVVVLPVLGHALGGSRMALTWLGAVFAQLLILLLADKLGIVPVHDLLSPLARQITWGATLSAVTLSIALLASIYERTQQHTISEVERASAAKSAFLAHMSHEIRTPMTAILGFAEMLEEEKLMPDQLEHLHTIRRNGEYLITVINDILDLSRVEAGRVELSFGPLRPDLVLAEVAALIAPRARERGLELKVEVDPGAAGALRSDATRVRQILINLAANAVKFTEQGRVRLAALAEPPGCVSFVVEDTGPGIPPDKLSELFEPFTQVDTSMSRRHGGAGLGLAISRRLATALGGELTVTSEVGRGCRFALSLPAVAVRETPKRSARAAEQTPVFLHGRVLIAEDGADNQRLLLHLLERWGLDVEVAENGAVAIERVHSGQARGEPIELVLMDMQMPEVDGYEATRRLRSEGFRAPILALTAHAMEGARETCLAAGCDDFLTKPVDRAQLLAAIASRLPHA
jgi:signal transduction histidine kinase/CheY-like chemotaxis protein